MQWFREKIGLAEAPPPQPAGGAGGVGATEADAAKLLRTQRLKLGQLKAEYDDVDMEFREALAGGNQSAARAKLVKKRELEAQMRQLEGKINNQAAVLNTLSTADANLQQARVVREGADQLGALVKETEKIDLDGAVDSFQDSAALTNDYSNRLSEPLFYIGSADPDAEDVDVELARMMEESALASMTVTTTPTSTPTTKPQNKVPNPIRARHRVKADAPK